MSTVDSLTRKPEDAIAKIDSFQIRKFAQSLSRYEWIFDKFDDPLMYPEKDLDPDFSANFFFFLVAIDHRTHPPGQIFRGVVTGNELTGAELLWALAKRRLKEDPYFFSVEHLSRVSSDEISDLFQVDEPTFVRAAGPEERAFLLRDCASKLIKQFGGSVLTMIGMSENQLLREDGRGFLQLLKQFEAYKDPLNKKSFLLVKFLERRQFLVVRDSKNLHVPVDSIVLRLALRTGMVKLIDEKLESKIRSGVEVTANEEQLIRLYAMETFDNVAMEFKMNTTYLDDILWEFGRVHCRVPTPICNKLPELASRRPYRMIKSGPVGECPFGPGCKGYMKPDLWNLKEPNFKTVFY